MSLTLAVARDVAVAIVLLILYGLVELNILGGPNVRGFFRNDTSIRLPMALKETVPTLEMVIFAVGVPVVAMIIVWFVVDKVHRNDFIANDIEYETVEEHLSGVPLLKWLKTPGHVRLLNDTVAPLSAGSPSAVSPIPEDFLESGRIAPTDTQRNGVSQTNNATIVSSSSYPEITSRRTPKSAFSQAPYSEMRPILDTTVPMRLNLPSVSALEHWATNSQDCSPKNRKWRFALYQFLIFWLLTISCSLITNVIKNIVGRLRPDFMDRCQPDWNDPDVQNLDPFAPYVPASLAHICKGSAKIITEGRKSFPSGHSSSSMFAAVFTMIYLGKRCSGRCRRALGYLFLPVVQVIVLCGALAIAASRSLDNRHHAGDIIGGGIIGVLCGLMSLLFPIFTAPWEFDGSVIREYTGISQECIDENSAVVNPNSETASTSNLELEENKNAASPVYLSAISVPQQRMRD